MNKLLYDHILLIADINGQDELITDQDDELLGIGAVEDAVCTNGFPEVFVYGVIHATVGEITRSQRSPGEKREPATFKQSPALTAVGSR